MRVFVERDNNRWLAEKFGYLTPHLARSEWFGEQMPVAA